MVNFLRECLELLRKSRIFATVKRKNDTIMEATTTTTTAPKKRISRTMEWALSHKWMIEVLDPELQKQCKAYKDGQRIIRP